MRGRRKVLAEFAAKVTPENGKGSVIQFDMQDSVLLKRILWFVRYGFKIKMAEATGLEPATSTVTGWHSNQLSYASA